ncbi:MAG: SIS domain-containing protein [Ruthenibacterium sp.]
MLKFDRKDFIEKETLALQIVPQVEKVVDEVCKKGYSNIFYVGIGGTVTYAWQMESIVKSSSTLKLYVENAADFLAMGNKNFTKDSIMVIESASGDTKEVVEAVEYAHSQGVKVMGFIEKPESPLAKSVDYLITNDGGGYYYWYAVTLRFMHNDGQFADYDKFMAELKNMPAILADVQEKHDAKAAEYVDRYKDEYLQYLIGAGNLWGWAYCYAMCIMEEMQWMRTKSISAADFFHGTLEVIERDDVVVLFKGEDASRKLIERAENFLHTICDNVIVFDTADFELKGISPEYRGLVSPFVMNAACRRISVHLEDKRKHPLEIRRYYRRLNY